MAKILIVDDEKNIRSGLAIAFEDEGYDTAQAEDGEQAWSIIQKQGADLVVTDLRMPVMSGYELLKKISGAYPTLPVIVLTGHGTIEDAVQAMREGAVDFFTKPVDLDHLILTVSKALSNKEIKEQNPEVLHGIERLFAGRVEVEFVPHTALKAATRDCKAVIRTGEITPYANIILQSGCIFG